MRWPRAVRSSNDWRAIQVVDTFFVPRPLQEAALELVGSPAWPRHLRAVSAELRNRRDTIDGRAPAGAPRTRPAPHPLRRLPPWLRLPDGTDESALVFAALREGVAVAPGRPYFSAEPPAGHLRLSFAAVGTGEITEGVRRRGRRATGYCGERRRRGRASAG